jgi:hypothetical protein
MRVNAFTCAIALAIAAGLAACGKDADRDMAKDLSRAPAPPQPTTSAPASNTPTTPANLGTPSAAEKQEGSNPQQGQVDPKQPEQRKDFQKTN